MLNKISQNCSFCSRLKIRIDFDDKSAPFRLITLKIPIPMNKQLISNSYVLVCLGNTVGTYQLRVNNIIFNRTNLNLNSSFLKSWSSCNFSILISIRVLFQVFILIKGRHLIAALSKYGGYHQMPQ